MPTVQDAELQMLREYEKAIKTNDEDRKNELMCALRILRELFKDHLFMGGR